MGLNMDQEWTGTDTKMLSTNIINKKIFFLKKRTHGSLVWMFLVCLFRDVVVVNRLLAHVVAPCIHCMSNGDSALPSTHALCIVGGSTWYHSYTSMCCYLGLGWIGCGKGERDSYIPVN
jgi:hypothetical protein